MSIKNLAVVVLLSFTCSVNSFSADLTPAQIQQALDMANLLVKTKELCEIEASIASGEKAKAKAEFEQKRLESADRAQFIWEYLNENGVDQQIIETLLKTLP